MHAKLLQLRPTLCNPMDCSLPGSSVHGILQARYWSGLLCPPPGDLPDPGMEPMSLLSPALAGRFFTTRATREAPQMIILGSNQESKHSSMHNSVYKNTGSSLVSFLIMSKEIQNFKQGLDYLKCETWRIKQEFSPQIRNMIVLEE